MKKSELVISTTQAQQTQESSQSQASDVTSDYDKESSDEIRIDTYVILNNENTTINGAGATFENNILTVNDSGTYSISGQLSDGKIYVNSADKEKKVKLYFGGVDITCSDDAPVFIENSPKETVIILAENTVNTLTDSADRKVPEDGSDYATATIYSKDDLQIEGKGTLEIKANFNKGIFSKNDIDIRGGNITVTSADDGIRGKESVDISDGNITIVSGGDGIRTNETAKTDKGDINISGGNINITSELDGVQSVRNIQIKGGKLFIKAGGGAGEPKTDSPFGGMGNMPGGQDRKGGPARENMSFGGFGKDDRRPPESSLWEDTDEQTPCAKGIKAVGSVTLSGAAVSVDSADDSIHADNIKISSGSFSLKSTDDGLHADTSVKIEDGVINIPVCYEGIEGQVIDVTGGSINLTSSDDGFNAVSPDSNSSQGGPGMMQTDESCQINISGGYIHLNTEGDGVDSNGNVNMTDGTLIVFGPVSGGNGALDYNGQFNVSGGTVLALGSAGMAQSVTGSENVKVYAYNYSQQADSLSVITDEQGEIIIGFRNSKSYQTMVLATDKISDGEKCTVYQGGSVDAEGKNGIYFDGRYSPGTEVGTLG